MFDIVRSIETLHNQKMVRFIMDIPLDGIFGNSESSNFYGDMQKGFLLKDSEILLIMAKMVRKIEEEKAHGMA